MKFHPDSLRAKREFKLQACDVEHKLTIGSTKNGRDNRSLLHIVHLNFYLFMNFL